MALNLSGPDLNELDRRLQEMAMLDFKNFCKLAGINKEQAYVCFEIAKGKSIRQVGIRLNIGKTKVHLISKKCPQKKDRK